jgi:hypothetical protein
MYFKGMQKIVKTWEQERIDKRNEDAFNQAFDEIFEGSTISEISSEEEETSSEEEGWETDSDISHVEETFPVPEATPFEPEPIEEEFNFSWKFNYSDFILEEIKGLQKDYQKAMDLGVEFDWYLDNFDYFDIEKGNTIIIYYEMSYIIESNIFVSKYPTVLRNKRIGKRVLPKIDQWFTTTTFVIVF